MNGTLSRLLMVNLLIFDIMRGVRCTIDGCVCIGNMGK